jgi:Transposase
VSTKSVMDTTPTGRRRNRSWPEAVKREIVAASNAPGSSVSMVARPYDVNANQVFRWPRLTSAAMITRTIAVIIFFRPRIMVSEVSEAGWRGPEQGRD